MTGVFRVMMCISMLMFCEYQYSRIIELQGSCHRWNPYYSVHFICKMYDMMSMTRSLSPLSVSLEDAGSMGAQALSYATEHFNAFGRLITGSKHRPNMSPTT